MNFQHHATLHSVSQPSNTLSTARLKLRPLQQGDCEAVFAMMSDAETMRFWDWPAFSEREVVDEIVAGQIADVRAGDALYWMACLGNREIGLCDLSEFDTHHRRAEIGFLFARPHWGQGYAREAMEQIVAHAFGPLGLERLWARFHAGNTASQRLLKRLGFAYEGTLKSHVLRDGERRDCEMWGRLR
jgi:RimJ/RimL family protein N-acetyltransferase